MLSVHSKHFQSNQQLPVHSARPQTADVRSHGSRAQSAYYKKRIIDQVQGMSDEQLDKMRNNLNMEVDDPNEDKMSVITEDKLKKFNEIYGYEHRDEEEEEEADKVDDLSNPNEGDEVRDEVRSLRSKHSLQS